MRRLIALTAPVTLGLIAGGAVGATPDTGAAMQGKPQRIVSFNLCSDQILLAVADRGQIAALSRNAHDPDMSAAAARAAGIPALSSAGEQVLAIDPDLVLGMPPGATGVLQRQGYRSADVRFANTPGDIEASLVETAALVGHPVRGAAVVARMRRDLAAIPRAGRGKVAAYYQRRGYMTGTGTLVDDLMQRVGLTNLAGKLNKPPLSQVSIEEMVAAQPDYLIVESATDIVTDQGSEMLHHPAMRDIPRIRVPEAWTVCGGPAYVDAARSIAEQIARHR